MLDPGVSFTDAFRESFHSLAVGMLSFPRWLAAIPTVVVLAATSAAVGTISPACTDILEIAAAPSAHSLPSGVASRISVVKHARTAWQSDAPFTTSAAVRGATPPLGDDQLSCGPREPRDLRIVATHDATGPPVRS